MSKVPLTVVILTFNEEQHIERCIASVRDLAERILIVDSFSNDRTLEIARRLGADVVQNPWKNYADQFQWGLDNGAITTEWVMRLDADEYLEPALVTEMRQRLPELDATITGINIKRKVIFKDRWIRYGGYYPTILLRVWRSGAGRIEQRWMDEHMVLDRGTTVTLDHDFVDHNLQDITWWTDKHNGYATRQMIDFINNEYGLFPVDRSIENTASAQAKLKRFLRNRVFGGAPLYLRGLLYFFYRYFLRLGFLDGRQGFVFHFLQGCWNWILIDTKIEEARTFIAKNGIPAFKEHLQRRYKIQL